ncbi:MAG: hypothetical protein QXL77_05630 [Candidatus Bathyarchaeia archaeon]
MSRKIEIKSILEKFVLTTLFSITIFGFILQAFILKTGVVLYLTAMFLTSLFFAVAMKNLKLGLLCMFLAALIGVFLAWIALILPPLALGEVALVSFTTDIFAYYAVRYVLISVPAMLIGILIGSAIVEAL